MENRSHALIAGLFVLLLGLAAAGSLWWFGGKREVTQDYIVTTGKNVTGLSLQAQVRYRGIRVGKVESIDLDPSNARRTLIRIRILDEIPVTRSTTAKLGFQGITGIAHILLEDDGVDTTPLAGSQGSLPQIAMQDSLIDQISDVGTDTLRSAREFLESANQLLSPDNRDKIARILGNLETTTGEFQQASVELKRLLSPENVRLLQATLVNAEKSTAQLGEQIGPLFADTRALVLRLQSASDKFETTLADISGATGKVNEGLQALTPSLGELATDLSSNSRQLGRVLRMLEDTPQSLLFGRDAAPGPGEAGFETPATDASRR